MKSCEPDDSEIRYKIRNYYYIIQYKYKSAYYAAVSFWSFIVKKIFIYVIKIILFLTIYFRFVV